MTDQITWRSPAPTTDFVMEADIVSQDPATNTSKVRMYAKAINRGNTSSAHGSTGSQTVAVDGYGGGSHVGTMPGGYATNAQRWRDGPFDVDVVHDADGFLTAGVTLRQTIAVWFSNVSTIPLGGFVRIPKAPTKPGTPVASEILPTSLRLTWTAPSDDKGSTIDNYRVRRYENGLGTGSYTDDTANNLTRVLSGLTPGKQYSFEVYAHNGSYAEWSIKSDLVVVTTLAPVRIKYLGSYKFAIPYIKIGGVYKMALPFIKYLGQYKRSG